MNCTICSKEINDDIYYRIVGTTEVVCTDCKTMLDRNEIELQREQNGECIEDIEDESKYKDLDLMLDEIDNTDREIVDDL